jgi:hypothetical protein
VCVCVCVWARVRFKNLFCVFLCDFLLELLLISVLTNTHFKYVKVVLDVLPGGFVMYNRSFFLFFVFTLFQKRKTNKKAMCRVKSLRVGFSLYPLQSTRAKVIINVNICRLGCVGKEGSYAYKWP